MAPCSVGPESQFTFPRVALRNHGRCEDICWPDIPDREAAYVNFRPLTPARDGGGTNDTEVNPAIGLAAQTTVPAGRRPLRSRWRLRFSPELERAYREHHASQSLPFIRACLLLAVGIFASFGLLIPQLNPITSPRIYCLFFCIVCPLLLACYVMTYFSFYRKMGQLIVFFQAAAIALGILALVWMTRPNEPGFALNYAGLILTVQSAFVLGRLRWLYTVLLSALALFGYAFVTIAVQGRYQSYEGPTVTLNNLLYLLSASVLSVVGAYWLEFYQRRDFIQAREIEAEKRRAEAERRRADELLLRILPAQIADRLKNQPGTIAEAYIGVSVLFLDIVDFTPMCERMQPDQAVQLLSAIFSRLDALAVKHGIERIKTVGDAYMVAAGVPAARPDHAEVIGHFALEALAVVQTVPDDHGQPMQARLGIDTGPAIAGVIGESKFLYDLWGDMVNTASRMESHGIPGRIQATARYHKVTKHVFRFETRGVIEVKGKGPMETFFLLAPLATL